MADLPERDWRYLSQIKAELVENTSLKLNDKIRAVLANSKITEDDKRRKVFDLVKQNDRVIAQCFDDWRRTELFNRCLFLLKHKVLQEAHLQRLAPARHSPC